MTIAVDWDVKPLTKQKMIAFEQSFDTDQAQQYWSMLIFLKDIFETIYVKNQQRIKKHAFHSNLETSKNKNIQN